MQAGVALPSPSAVADATAVAEPQAWAPSATADAPRGYAASDGYTTDAGDSYNSGQEAEAGPLTEAPLSTIPTEKEHRRLERVGQTQPILRGRPVSDQRKDLWNKKNDAFSVSIVGWLFWNWGALPNDDYKRKRIELALKKNPAQMIALAECQEATARLLRDLGQKGDAAAIGDALLSATPTST